MNKAEKTRLAQDAHQYRLKQAEELLRACGYIEVEPGKFALPVRGRGRRGHPGGRLVRNHLARRR